jgi:glycosyltransferase involved in cell wall biosynthesis
MDNIDNNKPDTINKVQDSYMVPDTNKVQDADKVMSRDSCLSDSAPLISVITITYNAASVIRPTLQSLNSQTFRNFEHLVIDGASKDDTVSIVRGMCPDSIIRSEPDRGLYDAMNKGLRAAKGKYLLFLNAGDALHTPDTLRHYADAARLNGKNPLNADENADSRQRYADIIYGDTIVVDSDRHFVKPRHLSVPDRLTFRSFANGMLVCHQAFMVRRDLAPEYDLQYRFSADFEWTLRCLKAADPDRNVNLHTVTIDYLSDGMTDKNHSASLKERYRIMCRYYGTIPTLLRHIRFLLRHFRF